MSFTWACKITLRDYDSQVTEDASIGLYNRDGGTLTSDASSGQKSVEVTDASDLAVGDVVYIYDNNNNEYNVIDNISSNTLTMLNDLANTYETAESADVNAGSQFRWLMSEIATVTDHATGMLVENGISRIVEYVDVRKGGNVASFGGSTITVKNTDKFWKTLDDNSIYLQGLKAEIDFYENATPTTRYTGFCGVPAWDAKIYRIPVSHDPKARSSNIGTLINDEDFNILSGSDDEGKFIPVTFGNWPDKRAVLQRSANINDMLFSFISSEVVGPGLNYVINPGRRGENPIFPVLSNGGGDSPTVYNIQMGTSGILYQNWVSQTSGVFSATNFNNELIHCISGTGEGQYREIRGALIDLDTYTDRNVVSIEVDNVFAETLDSVSTSPSSWVQFSEFDRNYSLDVWPCYAFYDDEGNEISSGDNISGYIYKSKQTVGDDNSISTEENSFIRIPETSLIESDNGNLNVVNYNLNNMLDNPDKLSGIIPYQLDNLTAYNEADLSDWEFAGLTRRDYGIYSGSAPTSVTSSGADMSNAIDKSNATLESFDADGTSWTLALEFNTPVLDFDFDSVYLGIDGETDSLIGFFNAKLTVKWQDPMGYVVNCFESSTFGTANTFYSIPDIYYGIDTYNEKFYYPFEDGNTLNGYTNFEITDNGNSIDSKKFPAIKKIGVFIEFSNVSVTDHPQVKLRELCLIFKKNQSIGDKIYSNCAGRIFNDTWGTFEPVGYGDITAVNNIAGVLGSYFDNVCDPDNGLTFIGWSGGNLSCFGYNTSDNPGELTTSLDSITVTGGGGNCEDLAIDTTRQFVLTAGTGYANVVSYDNLGAMTKESYNYYGSNGSRDCDVDTEYRLMFRVNDNGALYYHVYADDGSSIGGQNIIGSVGDASYGVWVDTTNKLVFSGAGTNGLVSFSYNSTPVFTKEDTNDQGGTYYYVKGDVERKLVFVGCGNDGIRIYRYDTGGNLTYLVRSYLSQNLVGQFSIDTQSRIIIIENGSTNFVSLEYEEDGSAMSLLDTQAVSGGSHNSIDTTNKVFFVSNLANDLASYTYGGLEDRATNGNLIESPIDIFEHVCRLQNWSERSIPSTSGWGKSYSDMALIKSSGVGSFDSTYLNTIDNLRCARQILKEGDGYTNNIKRSLCRAFWMINYIDEDGYECLVPLDKIQQSPSDSIGLGDIVIGNNRIEISEFDNNDIYPEPFVRFDYNPATKKFDSIIEVTNIDYLGATSAQKQDFVKGMYGSEAESLWDDCNTLYQKTRIKTKPPNTLTDLYWASGKTSNSLDIAKWYLNNWVQWMSLRFVKFSVHWTCYAGSTYVRSWHPGTRFILALPHHTNSQNIECIVTKISIDTNPPHYIGIEAVMIDSYQTPLYIQEVMFTASEGADLDIQETDDIGDTNAQEIT